MTKIRRKVVVGRPKIKDCCGCREGLGEFLSRIIYFPFYHWDYTVDVAKELRKQIIEMEKRAGVEEIKKVINSIIPMVKGKVYNPREKLAQAISKSILKEGE